MDVERDGRSLREKEAFMAGTFSRSWQLLKESAAVLRDNTSLIVFPVVSGICTLIVSASFMVPGFFLINTSGDSESINPALWVLLFFFYLVNYFVVIFFNAALIFCVRKILHGQPTTFSEGMGEAWRNVGKILGWAAISATVGMLLQMIRENAGILGKIIVGLIGMAWNLLTFFVIPVLIFEGVGPIEAIKRSGSIFKRTWGESVIGQFSLGAIFGLLSLLGIVPVVLAILTKTAALIIGAVALMVVYWFMLAMISASLMGIYRTALYEYATTGQVSPAFSQQAIVSAFQAKPQKKPFGT
jgi:hypothetical protein